MRERSKTAIASFKAVRDNLDAVIDTLDDELWQIIESIQPDMFAGRLEQNSRIARLCALSIDIQTIVESKHALHRSINIKEV